MSSMIHDPVDVARLFLFLREVAGKQNIGQRVEAIQKWCGGKAGDSYCCYLATMVLDICFQGNSPIPREGSCQVVYDLCEKNGWLTDKPSEGDLFFYINDAGHAHHIGIVTQTTAGVSLKEQLAGAKPGFYPKLVGIAGNTSEDGKSSNGTGVFEHGISAKKFAHYPRG